MIETEAAARPPISTLSAANPDTLGIPKFVDALEASRLLHCSLSHVYDLFDECELEGIRSGRKVNIFLSSIADYIERHRNRPRHRPKEVTAPPLKPPRPQRPTPGLCLDPPPPP
jgi:excisionase family DNA binding protein